MDNMRQPTLDELAQLSYSVPTLYEWLAYKDYAEKFYGPEATRVVRISEDWDSDIGTVYSVSGVQVYAGETLLQPCLDRLTQYTDEPFTDSSGEDEIAGFLDDFVAHLPVPFQFGNVHEQETVEIDLVREPANARLASRLLLADDSQDTHTASDNGSAGKIYLVVTGKKPGPH